MAIPPRNAGASSSRRRPIDDHEDISDEDERPPKPFIMDNEEGWTKETFVDRPIPASQTNVVAMATVHNRLGEMMNMIKETINQARDAAQTIEECSPNDDKILEVEKIAMRAIEQYRIVEIKYKVFGEIIQELRAGQDLVGGEGRFKQETKAKTEEYMSKTIRQKFKEDAFYEDFRQVIWEVKHPHEGRPPLSTWLPREDADESDDEDFEVGGTLQTYRCPLSLLPYEDAVRSTTCGHSFSRKAIEGLIESTAKSHRDRKKPKCPVTGCNHEITKAFLEPNPELQARSDRFLAQQKKMAEQEEDEAVDISQDD
ncbi:hypothetical protein BCR39DRAFT_526327 [Naematelia encephala]|uniref:SP-RING-type domain-containing protein n=1 Tax=Naematelia encephala TaxID=71784 RepID=A0A1Y2B945_9TREE|nr:hypothetical protein BCR39DRAFT_526327 [Naematelia encephala]